MGSPWLRATKICPEDQGRGKTSSQQDPGVYEGYMVFTSLPTVLSHVAFLPRSKYLLIFMAVVTICSDFGAQEDKVCHCFHCFPTICHEVMGLDAMIFIF